MAGNVFITGVSSGIGLALAREYLRRGWTVFGLSRREPPDLESPAFKFVHADLAIHGEIADRVRKLLAGLDRIDLTILNAGMLGPIADLAETPLPEMQRVMDINLWANKVILDTLFQMQVHLPQVVGISSGAGSDARRGWNAYSISKSALNMLLALYAEECSETHFCALAPGIVDTAMQAEISNIPADPRFASLDSLRSARGTRMMPSAEEAAPRLIKAFAKALEHPSGSALDLRTLERVGG